MNTVKVSPDGTISDTFLRNYIKLRAIFLKNFAVLLVKDRWFSSPKARY